MKRWLKYSLVTLGSVLLLLFLLFVAVGLYINSNKQELISKYTKEAEIKYNTDISVADISLSFFRSFPSLTLVIKNIEAKGSFKINNRKLFKASEIYLRINTAKLFLGKIKFGKTSIKDGAVFIYTDSSGVSNLSLINSAVEKNKKENETLSPSTL